MYDNDPFILQFLRYKSTTKDEIIFSDIKYFINNVTVNEAQFVNKFKTSSEAYIKAIEISEHNKIINDFIDKISKEEIDYKDEILDFLRRGLSEELPLIGLDDYIMKYNGIVIDCNMILARKFDVASIRKYYPDQLEQAIVDHMNEFLVYVFKDISRELSNIIGG